MNTELSTGCLLWALLMFCCPHPAWSTDSLEVKMTNMMERMTRMETTKDTMISLLRTEAETRERRLTTLEEELSASNAMISALRKDLEDRKESSRDAREDRIAELEEEMRRMAGRLDESEGAELELRGMLDKVRNRMAHCRGPRFRRAPLLSVPLCHKDTVKGKK